MPAGLKSFQVINEKIYFMGVCLRSPLVKKGVYFSYAQQNALPPDNLNDRKMITKLSVVLSLIAALFLNGCNHAEHETHHELPKLEATTP
ncbi:MAG: hypothetical protein H6940_04780, partial [Burkholderiales bacterium]|nr:hypothetical protein [Burkholderiales bacterium]